MDKETRLWRETLRQVPVPELRERFADYALSWATRGTAPQTQPAVEPRRFSRLFTRRETWLGAVVGAAAAASVTLVLLRPPPAGHAPVSAAPGITLALNEVRSVDVLVDSERPLPGATIRVTVSGGLSLEGFDGEREISWSADLDRGRNVLTLPILARSAGAGQLVAHIEHQGRTRQVTVNLTVLNSQVTPS